MKSTLLAQLNSLWITPFPCNTLYSGGGGVEVKIHFPYKTSPVTMCSEIPLYPSAYSGTIRGRIGLPVKAIKLC